MIPVVTAGQPAPLGATPDADGVNFAVFSAHATRMVLCLFDAAGRETQIDLPERDGDIWHGHVAGIAPGQLYGLRAHGPYRPDEGHRFNPHKLLLDPYARRLTGHPVWDDSLMGFTVGSNALDLSFDTRCSARSMPRCVVEATDWASPAAHPHVPLSRTVIYEAHLKGLTQRMVGLRDPGTFAAIASDPVIEHLVGLGITTLELLPCQAFLNDRFLVEKDLTNYWGYQTIGFFAPEPRYMAGSDIAQFRHMVDRLHAAGIEVVMDVVYNHSGEGNEMGPTLSFRGLDNASYYRLERDPRYYVNDTGTGNTLRCDHPMVLRMIMDSLRYWVQVMGVDGFRFDLATTLGRRANGFDRDAPLFQAMRQDPVLARTKLIAEPWDIGPGGYQLGGFTAPFLAWNDKFRDGVRRFWRGDPGRAPDLAARITGSALQFDHSGRRATSSVNMLTAHDGFTLMDVVSYTAKHNEANGEDGRDGHSENFSWNFGVEGPSDDPRITSDRALARRNMLATLMLSQGTPMLLAGDEIGNSQGGNNNAYNQDNEIAWLDWPAADAQMLAFTRRLIAFRAAHPILRQSRFLHARERAVDGQADLFWHRADGAPMQSADWVDPGLGLVVVEMRTASGTPEYDEREEAVLLAFNAKAEARITLPPAPEGQGWFLHLDTTAPDAPPRAVKSAELAIPAQSVSVLVLAPT